ncbi:hypothetical protein [Vagococcus fluvialis]|uniref:Uncharacterized protein n=1 Tax=Vagococcus fluvialis TaxID=2738 RepID=A0A7X6D695_9ENTE|nr:hypothetical protein [Vagococcus fluvialis]NKC66527.1 hypothetical protein [Vagococcus fluvialis]
MTYYDKSMNYLNEFFELVPISANRLPDFHLKILTENAVNSIIGQQYQLTSENVDFKFYQIKKTVDNCLYFSEEESSFFSHPLINPEEFNEDTLLVGLEKTIGIIDCGSNRLFMELLLNQGYTLEDFQNKELALDYKATRKVFTELYTLSHIPKSHPIHQALASKK